MLALHAAILILGAIVTFAEEEPVLEATPVEAPIPLSQKECGPGEVWKECVSSFCAEVTCESIANPAACTDECSYGCFCMDGFARNVDKACVPRDLCPQAASADEPPDERD